MGGEVGGVCLNVVHVREFLTPAVDLFLNYFRLCKHEHRFYFDSKLLSNSSLKEILIFLTAAPEKNCGSTENILWFVFW